MMDPSVAAAAMGVHPAAAAAAHHAHAMHHHQVRMQEASNSFRLIKCKVFKNFDNAKAFPTNLLYKNECTKEC
jgi:hypothetical protein